MKKGTRLILFICVIFLLFTAVDFVSAGVTLGKPEYSIKTLYEPGDSIDGWINISLNNEPTTSMLKSSFGESINLFELLGKESNSDFVKTCNAIDCFSAYIATSPSTSKTFNLNENSSVLFGFDILGNARDLLSDISSFTFNLTSNNPETEKLPLAIDILNDGSYEWNPYLASDSFGSENKGCFLISTGQANIAQISYCERIRISRTPEVELGAYVQGNTPGIDFHMSIDSVDSSQHGTCTTNSAVGGAIERVSCVVPSFSVNEDEDYFVCIKTSSILDANKYKINIEEDSIKCGFSSTSGGYEGSYNYDFDIFARPKKYLGAINFSLNDDELENARSYLNNIEAYVEEYITAAYGNNCSKGCVIPVKIYSGVSQQITLSNTYVTDPYLISYIAGISTSTDEFYDIGETPALMSSGFRKLYLTESGFRVPLEIGNQTLSISLSNGGEKFLFSGQISVNIPEPPKIKALTPNTTGIKYPTEFTVLLNGTMNITKYGWNFGDGQSQNTTKAQVTHTYNTAGTYVLKVSLLDASGNTLSSREFNIIVAPASQIVPSLLAETEAKVSQIKIQMKNFSAFEQKAINKSLNLGGIESSITRLKTSASQATTEPQFETILGELLLMKIPNSVAKTAYSSGIAFYPTGTNINLDVLKQIGGGDYDAGKEEQYKEAIIGWDGANVNTVMFYGEISSIYPDYQETLLKTFDITIAKSGSETAYIVIRKMANMLFKDDYSQKTEGDYYYIDFDTSEKHIVFSTTENVDFFTLPMFISPPISELSLTEWNISPEEKSKKWVMFGIVTGLVIFIAILAWIILKIWYKRRYENYLFKNRNNLYNLVNYIQNEKIKGTKEADIGTKLRRAGWSSEQVRYALRKHAGKPTGMPELIKLRKSQKEKTPKR